MLTNNERAALVALSATVLEIVRRTPGATEIKDRVFGVSKLKAALDKVAPHDAG